MKKWAIRLIPIVFYVLLAVFLVLYLRTIDFERILEIDFDWRWIAVASVIAMFSRYWFVYIWLVILTSLGASKFENIPELSYVYAKSWLGRYIPGTAPWILGKIYFASQKGLSKSKLAVSSFLEGGLQVIVLLVVGLVMVLVDSRTSLIDPALKWTMAAVAVAGIVALIPPIFNRIAALGYRIIRKKQLSPDDLPRWSTVGRGAGLYLIGSLLSGLSMFFVAKAVWPELPWETLLYVVGAANLASAASMVAIFVPSGIGVREAILVALLSVVMPTEFAFVAAIVLRLWSILIDLLFFAVASVHTRIHNRRNPPQVTADVAP